MALPSFNLTAKNVPADKQMSMMRTYLSQLKDETETELYDIKWDNLSQSLRKRIEDLDAYVNQVNDYSQMTAQSIKANVIDANYIRADQVDTLELDASQIKTGYLAAARIEAGSITASKLDTAYIATSWIDAATGFVAKFHSINLSANQIKAININANQITAGEIDADRLSASAIRGKIFGSESANIDWINATNIKLTSGVVMDIRLDSGLRSFTFQPVTMNGYYVLAAAQPH